MRYKCPLKYRLYGDPLCPMFLGYEFAHEDGLAPE